MSFSLYDATIANYLQTLAALGAIMDRATAHFTQQGTPMGEIVEARLVPDMLPFRFQIMSVTHHSLGAITGAKQGLFKPPPASDGLDFAALQALVAQTQAGLSQLSRDEVNDLAGREVIFALGERRMPFVAEEFLMSFSLPNFYFHATTAYDLLRLKGMPLGKRDYLGRLRMKA